ncbi:heme peroxidase [Mesorhizobium sp. B3-1-3]|uniref:peroxidase family protein n=1 Tax=unclassified Mesorhizobium TaxID=325217 RepID=UPI00112992E3|nr:MULTISPECIES: heme peroxidase family protein [unclassified Mesorhizobium]TPI62531.1 heme peroxidase [Mesorhizobium sp. B3-1-8]TPI74100.1 heme peroxidase [Mesorhizobium sp. B3-1-3]
MKNVGVPLSQWGRRSSFHGTLRGGDNVTRSSTFEGRFGRMFRALPAANFHPEDLLALGDKMEAEAEEQNGKRIAHPEKTAQFPDENAPDDEENFGIPAGYTYLGQFIDHDITFDPSALSMQRNDPDALVDFRTPRLDLDCIYGRGPADQPYMYTEDRKFILGATKLARGNVASKATDLPRAQNGRAIIGDKRNDENVIVSQLQNVFLNFHNALCDRYKNVEFDDIQKLVRWHYQWVVLTDFLPKIVGENVMADILPGFIDRKINIHTHAPNLRFFKWRNDPFMPVEFSAAAYRVGHSMVRPIYRLSTELTNPVGDEDPSINGRKFIFAAERLKGLNGFGPFPENWAIDWSLYFELGGKKLDPKDLGPSRVQPSYKLDTSLVNPLKFLPEFSRPRPGHPGDLEQEGGNPAPKKGDVSNLASRNLLRGMTLGLPSGQDVARYMDIEPIEDDELRVGKAIVDDLGRAGNSILDVSKRFAGNAPLWYYVLAEAQWAWTKAAKSASNLDDVTRNAIPVRLGPVGARIVAEVLIGLIVGDKRSVLWQAPNWKPILGKDGEFNMPNLIQVSGLGTSHGQ